MFYIFCSTFNMIPDREVKVINPETREDSECICCKCGKWFSFKDELEMHVCSMHIIRKTKPQDIM